MTRNNTSPSAASDTYLDVTFSINGRQTSTRIRPSLLLIDLIRDELGLTGTKPGCFEGECGACTVLLDGDAVNSCIYLAANIDGRELTTIEGLSGDSDESSLDPVQRAVIEHGAVQCGFCTSGMVIAIKSFKTQCDRDRVVPDREAIKQGLAGNLCRCTGYSRIIDAVESLFEDATKAK
jgi:carbon-monoxide dehydrogenase small subunit